MKKGEISQPVLSEVGYHIIKFKDKKQLDPYDSLRADIMKFIERRSLRQQIAQNRLKDIAVEESDHEQQVMDAHADSMSVLTRI